VKAYVRDPFLGGGGGGGNPDKKHDKSRCQKCRIEGDCRLKDEEGSEGEGVMSEPEEEAGEFVQVRRSRGYRGNRRVRGRRGRIL
jgi:hypothetical protein